MARHAPTPAPVKRRDFPLEPALDFLQHLWALNHALERTSLRMERAMGVTAQQRLVLRCLGKYPGLTPSQLAAVLHLDRGTVSVTLRRLEQRGLVSRAKDRDDARKVVLALSAKGRRLDRPTPGTVEAAVEALLQEAGAAKVTSAKALLRALTERLSADLPPR